jgi:hypothetical protein
VVGDQLHRALEIGEQHGHVFALALESTLGGQDLLGEVLWSVGLGGGEPGSGGDRGFYGSPAVIAEPGS